MFLSDNSIEHYKCDGPILLLAAPGTGKTYQLAKRIKYLIEEKGIDPSQVTVITFTAPAASSMRGKISDPESNLFIEQKNSRKRYWKDMKPFEIKLSATFLWVELIRWNSLKC